jgi:hypothetical protein
MHDLLADHEAADRGIGRPPRLASVLTAALTPTFSCAPAGKAPSATAAVDARSNDAAERHAGGFMRIDNS